MKKLNQNFGFLSRNKKTIQNIGLFIILFAFLLAISFLFYFWTSQYSYESPQENKIGMQDFKESEENEDDCTYGIVSIQGNIVGFIPKDDYEQYGSVSSEDIIYTLEIIDRKNFPVVMLDITSWGGTPAPSKEIADFVAQMKTPVVASIRESGLSGGYYIASQADKVFASPASDIGSIGVSMSYIDGAILNEKEGYTWNNLSTGKFKDSGSAEKSLTQEERELFQRDLDILHTMFVQDVARGRSLSVEEVSKLADGGSMLSEQALQVGLIDGVKHQWEAMDYIEENYNLDGEACWY